MQCNTKTKYASYRRPLIYVSKCFPFSPMIHVFFLAGKVHGSLARAGKVKNQTPKQPPTEVTCKVPRGRAKKRLLYNRRFVNAASTMGRKVGPNNNAARIAREEAMKEATEAAV